MIYPKELKTKISHTHSRFSLYVIKCFLMLIL